MLGRAGEAGQKQRLAAAAQGQITYRPARGLVVPGMEGKDGEELTQEAGTPPANRPSIQTVDQVPHESLDMADELTRKLDEVNNHESHRTRGGRDIKVSS